MKREHRVIPLPSAVTAAPEGSDQMFLFYSNRVGCLVSLLLSAALTVLLIMVLYVW
jgi:hypothetical protein